MIFFNKKKWNNIQKNEELKKVFFNLLSSSTKIELNVIGRLATLYLLEVENFLKFSHVDPLYLNNELFEGKQYKFKIESLINSELHHYEFYLNLQTKEETSDDIYYYFSFPEKIKQFVEDYSLKPLECDNVKVQFVLKNLPYYKKIKTINKNEMTFEGQMHHLLKEYKEKTIYDIELFFPLDKIKIAAIFNHVHKDIFSFSDFITSEMSSNAYNRYAGDYFAREKCIGKFQKLSSNQNQSNKKDNDINIFICDDKETVTDYLYHVIRKQLKNEIFLFNDMNKMFEIINHITPHFLIIDTSIKDWSFVTFFDKIKSIVDLNNICFIFIGCKPVSLNYDIGTQNIFWIKKPVQGKELLDIILKKIKI